MENNPVVKEIEPAHSPSIEITPSFTFWEQAFLVAMGYGVVSTLVTSLKEIVITKLTNHSNQLKYNQTIENIAKIYDNLQQIQVLTKSDGVCLCKVSNGGDIPKVNKPVFMTILYEIVDQPSFAVKHFWQQRPISKQMFDLIQNCFKGICCLDDKEGKDYAEVISAEELEEVVTVPIGNNPKEFYFLLIKYKNKIAFSYGFTESKLLGFIPILGNLLNISATS
ncbi:MAG: hypothetical protein ACRC80_14550 [Waterburya sp.]